MTPEEIAAAVARGRAKRMTAHLEKLSNKRKEMEQKVNQANTIEALDKLEKKVESVRFEHYRTAEKDKEYKCYEEAEYNEAFVDMYDDINTMIYNKKQSL